MVSNEKVELQMKLSQEQRRQQTMNTLRNVINRIDSNLERDIVIKVN